MGNGKTFNHIKIVHVALFNLMYPVRNEIYSSSDCKYNICCTLLMPSLMTSSKQNACLCACLHAFWPVSLPLCLLFCLQPCICRYLFFMPATIPTCLFAYHPALMPASKPTVLPASLLGTCLPVCMPASTPTCLFANCNLQSLLCCTLVY